MNFYIEPIYALDFTQMDDDDHAKVLEFRNHPSTSFWMYSKNISLASHLRFIEDLKKTPTSHYWLFKKNQILLGVGSITRHNQTHHHAYLGIYKNPHLSNVGTEILSCLEHIGFEEFGLHSLHLEVMATNEKAIAFYQKHDYIREGKLLEFICQDGTYRDVFIYGKINPKKNHHKSHQEES
ncbi:UDP-4-amino-4,6-dideoxy-N-acetyl-beta-L-altrosamine N-acetyltransferase [Helicobacter sp. 11S02596-1]|uniref:UDP-4-amino-4, 6-dideoxy-N-acetyl-beta-L-altrosamine N-acetyltransferase n=1 Tax=Helicobacter sp. 11S02596-1 TaxID=1476194 RepID=UPI000BA5866F|nr:UDP-4-amino-4,6-dideoxy-N-acetyl-beta-L-altrosamine N-acetyltransferase [Helicobacter sp. 11S02596-1]PAF42838.1 UDP-4-amino-4,6-dideoxy-N-acetyl-beta-L-altrosamine N-acetyltransferase [Helicobacter sp. 11S02596-1]